MALSQNNKIALAVGGAVFAAAIAVAGVYDYQQRQEDLALDANWTLVSNGDDGGKWYVDISTIKYEDGRYVQAWDLVSNPKADKDGTRSTKTLTIFDCQDRKYRIMSGSTTDKINGRGANTGTFGAGMTRDIPPSTNIGNIADYLCQPLYNRPSSDVPQQPRSEELKQI